MGAFFVEAHLRVSARCRSHFYEALVVLEGLDNRQTRINRNLKLLPHLHVGLVPLPVGLPPVLLLVKLRLVLHLNLLAPRQTGDHGLRRLILGYLLGWAVLRVVTLLLAEETSLVLNRLQVKGVAAEFRVQLLLTDLFLLAEG